MVTSETVSSTREQTRGARRDQRDIGQVMTIRDLESEAGVPLLLLHVAEFSSIN